MRLVRFLMLVAVLLLLSTSTAAWADHGERVRIIHHGEVFCAPGTLVSRHVLIQADRCFKLAVLRDRHRVFLAFLEPAVILPASRLVVLNSTTGFAVRERIVFLVPIDASEDTIEAVPVNSLLLVPVRVADFGPRLTIVAVDFPRVFVTFSVRLR